MVGGAVVHGEPVMVMVMVMAVGGESHRHMLERGWESPVHTPSVAEEGVWEGQTLG